MRSVVRIPFFAAICAITLAVGIAGCEDDPILAPQQGKKQANGSYGNIAIAPPVDSTDSHRSAATDPTINPEVY